MGPSLPHAFEFLPFDVWTGGNHVSDATGILHSPVDDLPLHLRRLTDVGIKRLTRVIGIVLKYLMGTCGDEDDEADRIKAPEGAETGSKQIRDTRSVSFRGERT